MRLLGHAELFWRRRLQCNIWKIVSCGYDPWILNVCCYYCCYVCFPPASIPRIWSELGIALDSGIENINNFRSHTSKKENLVNLPLNQLHYYCRVFNYFFFIFYVNKPFIRTTCVILIYFPLILIQAETKIV